MLNVVDTGEGILVLHEHWKHDVFVFGDSMFISENKCF